MKFLLDTHCFLWFFLSPHKLSMSVQEIINESSHEIYLSAASSWEITIKYTTGKLIRRKSIFPAV